MRGDCIRRLDCSQSSIFSYFSSIVEREKRIARELDANGNQEERGFLRSPSRPHLLVLRVRVYLRRKKEALNDQFDIKNVPLEVGLVYSLGGVGESSGFPVLYPAPLDLCHTFVLLLTYHEVNIARCVFGPRRSLHLDSRSRG